MLDILIGEPPRGILKKNKNPWFLALLVHFKTDFHCSKNFNDALYLSQYEYLSHPK
jgi:hypothetical protein